MKCITVTLPIQNCTDIKSSHTNMIKSTFEEIYLLHKGVSNVYSIGKFDITMTCHLAVVITAAGDREVNLSVGKM